MLMLLENGKSQADAVRCGEDRCETRDNDVGKRRATDMCEKLETGWGEKAGLGPPLKPWPGSWAGGNWTAVPNKQGPRVR